jgi:hypothetical protein
MLSLNTHVFSYTTLSPVRAAPFFMSEKKRYFGLFSIATYFGGV